MRSLFSFCNLLIILSLSLFMGNCSSNSVSGSRDSPSRNEAVSSDGVLETVTWNIEWYGDDSRGPSDEQQQTDNIVEVLDSLKADLYAFQEVYSQEVLDGLVSRLTGYRGFTARHINWIQKTAFVYNTVTIDSVSSGAIRQGQDDYDWANGRLPLYFSFKYHYQDQTVPVYAVVIHAKANIGSTAKKEEAYQRRRRAADSLYHYLQKAQPEAHIVLLGDYNDDLDVSIYDDSSPSPYEVFLTDSTHYQPLTLSLSQQEQSSYLGKSGTDLIDHIIISDEMQAWHISHTQEIYFPAQEFIHNYSTTTSDHLPVWAHFDIRSSTRRAHQ